MKGGYLAVCTFFVIRGYFSFLSLWKRDGDLKAYYLSRSRRIYLPLAVSVFFTVALFSFSKHYGWIDIKAESTSVLLGYNNYRQIDSDLNYFTRSDTTPFTHMWYISILLQYDLVFPLVVKGLKVLSRRYSRLAPLGFLFLTEVGSFMLFSFRCLKGDVNGAYYGTLSRLFSLLAGSFLGVLHLFHKPLVLKKPSSRRAAFLFYLFIELVVFFFADASQKRMAFWMAFVTMTAMRLIDNAMTTKRKGSAYLSFLAGLTYEVYLFQYPFLIFFDSLHMAAFFRFLLVVVSTLLTAVWVNRGLAFKKGILNIALSAMVVLVSLFGFYRYLGSKDHSKEMNELRDKLDENAKLIEEKNKDYMDSLRQSEEELNAILIASKDDSQALEEYMKKMPVVGIGDSILIDIADAMYDRFPNGFFDGKISRDLYNGMEILEELKEEGKLSNTIILCLSQNGDYIRSYNKRLMEIVEDRDVFWVDAVGADEPMFNEWFEEFAQNYDNLHIVHWEDASKEHPEYFYFDGIHVMEEGDHFMPDRIHLNEKGNALLAEKIILIFR